MLGSIVICSAVRGETGRLYQKRYPVSQQTKTIGYSEHVPQDVGEQQIGEPSREDGWRPVRYVDEDYRDMRRGHWHDIDEDYPETYGDYHHYRREGLGGSRIFPWNW